MTNALDPRSVAVAVASRRNAKLAALYFDYVVPIYCDEDVPSSLFPPAWGDWNPKTSKDVLRKMQNSARHKAVAVDLPNPDGSTKSIRLLTDTGEPNLDALEYVNQWMFLNSPELAEALRYQMYRAMIEQAAILLSGDFVESTTHAESANEVTAVLSGLPIVDVDNVSWQQILEFRKDPASRDRLRILRLHLADQFIGKSVEQIAAGLQLGIEQCERAAKKHGFDLLIGTLQASCESKETLGSIGVWGLIGAVAGGNAATAAAGASIGVALEIAKLSLAVAKGKRQLADLHRHHPYSYVLSAKREFE